jgi:O-antigen ligase
MLSTTVAAQSPLPRPRIIFILCGGTLAAIGLGLLALGIGMGGFALLLALITLALGGTDAYLIGVSALLPAATVGWTLQLAEFGGRSFDARLLLTFWAALLSVFLVGRVVRTLDWLDWLAIGLVAYLALDGLLHADSVFIWAPPVARWAVYASCLILARRAFPTIGGRGILMLAIALGFMPSVAAGLIQFATGAANEQNAAVRATGFIQSSPIALAFAGQAVVLMMYPLFARARSGWGRLLTAASMVLGAIAIVASATRIILVTAFGGAVLFASLRRRWREAFLISVVFVGSLAVRPDFLARFTSVVPTPSVTPGASTSPGSTSFTGDTSLQYRVFLWRVLLSAWSKSPVLGIGPGMAAPTIEAASPTSHRQASHNDYVGMLSEGGVLGLLLFVALQASVLVLLVRRWQAADMPIRDSIAMAFLAFVVTDVLGVLNNPIYAVELQAGLWAVAGAMLSPPDRIRAMCGTQFDERIRNGASRRPVN